MARRNKSKQLPAPPSTTNSRHVVSNLTAQEPVPEDAPVKGPSVDYSTSDVSTSNTTLATVYKTEAPAVGVSTAGTPDDGLLTPQTKKEPSIKAIITMVRTLRIVMPPAATPASVITAPVVPSTSAPTAAKGSSNGSSARGRGASTRGGNFGTRGGAYTRKSNNGSRGGMTVNANNRGHNNQFRGSAPRGAASHRQRQNISPPEPQYEIVTEKLYMDMEMVRAEGWNPVGRITLINDEESPQVVYDTFVHHEGVRIIDTQLRYSGIRWQDIDTRNGATEFKVAKQTVLDLVRGRILITHSGENEDKGLHIFGTCDERREQWGVKGRRDTQKFSRFRAEYPECSQGPGLKRLVADKFGVDIQTGSHCSLVDTKWTRKVYKTAEADIDAEQSVDDLTENTDFE